MQNFLMLSTLTINIQRYIVHELGSKVVNNKLSMNLASQQCMLRFFCSTCVFTIKAAVPNQYNLVTDAYIPNQ